MQDGEFVFLRPAQKIFGDHYAARPSFHLKKASGAIRVCYFGESTALGYLYAPHFSPAAYLEEVLNARHPSKSYEVIDLSMTNETLTTMLQKFQRAMQLKPDICIVFAGNNWPLLETPEMSLIAGLAENRMMIGKILAGNGPDAMSDQVVKRRLENIGRAYFDIYEIAALNNIEVIIVVPEANLADWESRQPPPLMDGKQANAWFRLYVECEMLLHGQSWQKLLEKAFELWDIDQGSCSTTYRLIALAQEQLGNTEAARLACRAEIDTGILPLITFMNAPQISSYDQAALRKLAAVYGFKIVDLPKIFNENNAGKLPGRDLFLDYCHLTEKGIALLVDNLASIIDDRSTAGAKSSNPHETNITPHHRALAYFGAAIHTAHRLLPITDDQGLLQYWCHKAYTTSPGIAKVMENFIEARASRIPSVLTDSQQQIVSSEFSLLHSHGWKYEHLDLRMIQAILETFKAHSIGNAAQIMDMLIRKLAIEIWGYDLASSSDFLWNPLEQAYLDLLKPAGFHQRAMLRSFWPSMTFGFISEGAGDYVVRLVARTINQPLGAEIKVSVNGQDLGQKPASQNFTRIDYVLPQSVIERGINLIKVKWPELDENLHLEKHAESRLHAGFPTDLAPVFGEIFSLRVENKI